jgi:hypothetical protein
VRFDVPGSDGQQWFVLRDVKDLTGGDEEAWDAPVAAAQDRQTEEDASAPAGAPPAPLRLPAGWVRKRLNDLYASLIMDWSFADPASVPHVPLPYTPEARLKLPLTMLNSLREEIKPHMAALNGTTGAGPKELPAPTSTTDGSGSSNGSKERSQSGPLVSVTEAPETASI